MYKICINLLILMYYLAISVLPSIAEQDRGTRLSDYSFDNSIKYDIPIREASGVALDPRNNLLYVHEDSFNPNKVYLFDLSGQLIKEYQLKGIKNNDWEDITTNGNGVFWIIDSKNSLIEFKTNKEGNLIDDSAISYNLPGDLKKYDIESLEYMKNTGMLIAITKGSGNKIFAFKPGDQEAIYKGKIPETFKMKPSGLAQHPVTANFFVISFWGHQILEISSDLKTVLKVMNMPASLSFQPEGITFDKNQNMIIVAEKPWYSLFGNSTLIKLFSPQVLMNYEDTETRSDR